MAIASGRFCATAATNDAMRGRRNKNGRSIYGPPFVQLFRFMLDCEAWQSLTTQERAVYVVLATRYNGTNNGRLALSVRDAAREANVAKDTSARALLTLVERGFTECVTPGGFSRKTPHAAEWRLTAYRCDVTATLPSKAFVRWRPDPAKVAVPNKGRGGPRLRTLNGLDVKNVQ